MMMMMMMMIDVCSCDGWSMVSAPSATGSNFSLKLLQPLPFIPSFILLSPSFSFLRPRPIHSPLPQKISEGSWERCNLHSGVHGRALSCKHFYAFGLSKRILWQDWQSLMCNAKTTVFYRFVMWNNPSVFNFPNFVQEASCFHASVEWTPRVPGRGFVMCCLYVTCICVVTWITNSINNLLCGTMYACLSNVIACYVTVE